ncbi:MAG: hypothetical protein HND58_19080 [Planctomycetota bacterium]|nr:MAG: hypothetical protein HND58_19080 [Planctomycetota bacterium]
MKTSLCVMLGLFAMLVGSVAAQEGMRCRGRDYVGLYDAPASVRLMVVRDNLAVSASGLGTAALLDVTDVLSPVVLSTFETPESVWSFQFVGERVFVCTAEELQIVDISDPEHPVELGVFPEGVRQVSVQGTQAYALVNGFHLALIDLADESNPVEMNRWRPPDYVTDLEWIGDFLYTSRSEGGIDIYDVSVWWNPRRVGSLDSERSGGELRTDGQSAYVLGGGWFRAFDVSNVEQPVELGATAVPYLGSFVIRGSRLYVATYDELEIYDISAEGGLDWIGWYEVDRWPSGVALRGDYAIVGGDEGGGWILDVSDPKLPPQTVRVPSGMQAKQVAREGSLLCAALGVNGVNLVDMTDPWNPVSLSTIDTPGIATGVAIDGAIVCVADMIEGMRVIDISEPDEPMIIGSVRTGGDAATIACAGHAAFVGKRTSNVIDAIDISEPSAPRRVGEFEAPRRPLGMVARGDLLYIADGLAGLLIVDVSNPSSPTLIGSLDTPGTAYGVFVEGERALVADGDGGVQVIDVRNPRAPELVGTVATTAAAFSVASEGDLGVVLELTPVLEAIDLSSPTAPTIVGSHRVEGQAGVALMGNAAMIAGGSRGLQIVNTSDCPPCDVDFNNDSVVDSRDVLAFLNVWVAGDSAGDFNDDGEVNDADVIAFLGAWMGGC